MDPWGILVVVGTLYPMVFWLGSHWGRLATRRKHRREIEAGREYLAALDEATRDIRGATRLKVEILVTRESLPAREGRALLREMFVDGDAVPPGLWNMSGWDTHEKD